MLVPPQLPPFLATVFDLKPITGAPSTDEVRLVHATIRALGPFLQTPELRDSDLPMELSQHLFDVQMASYRERYPVGIFPNDITYTPPKLPTHIPVKLEPVVGPPSDDQVRSAHAALRMLDSFANIASLFDADLSMQLSQYVFDLQLARHVQRSTQSQPPATRPVLQSLSSGRGGPPDSNATGESNGADADTRQGRAAQDGNISGTDLGDAQHSDTPRRNESPMSQEREEKNWPEETHKLLVDMGETLKDVKRALVGSQNSLARGFNSANRTTTLGYNLGAHSLINDKGETPEMHGLPPLHDRYGWSGSANPDNLTPGVLARYLQFYGTGSEVLDGDGDGDGDGELTIKSGMEETAKAMLRRRVYAHGH